MLVVAKCYKLVTAWYIRVYWGILEALAECIVVCTPCVIEVQLNVH